MAPKKLVFSILVVQFLAVVGNKTVADNSGIINVLPMIDGIYNEYMPGNTKNACKFETPEEQYARVDNGTHSVDFNGYLQMTDACNQAWKQVEFNRLDTNHDSQLSLQEWNDEQARIKKEIEEADLRWRNESFHNADSDGNGSLNKKEFEDFLKTRSLDCANASKYLDGIGGTMDLNEFIEFDKSVPNDTFPFKFEPFQSWQGNILVDPIVQTKPLAFNDIQPSAMSNVDVAAVDLAHPVGGPGPKIGIVVHPTQ